MIPVYDPKTGQIIEYRDGNLVYDTRGRIKEYINDNIVYDAETGRIKEYKDGILSWDAQRGDIKEFRDGNVTYDARTGQMKEFIFENDLQKDEKNDIPSFVPSTSHSTEKSGVGFQNGSITCLFWIAVVFIVGVPIYILLTMNFGLFVPSIYMAVPLLFITYFVCRFLDKKITDYWEGK